MSMDTTRHSTADVGKAPGSYLPASLNPDGYRSLTDVLAAAVSKYADLPALYERWKNTNVS